MAEKKETPESPKIEMEHKMHGMAEGQEMNEAGEDHMTYEMGLRPSESHKTHRGKHEGHVTEDFKRRFIISLIFTIPILTLSPFIQDLFRFKLEFSGSIYALFLSSTFVYDRKNA